MSIEPMIAGIKRPPRQPQPPRVFSAGEIEQLIQVGTSGDPLARAFLMTVFGCGLRLSEATHVQVCDIDSPRFQLLVSHPKGGRRRVTVLSPTCRLMRWSKTAACGEIARPGVSVSGWISPCPTPAVHGGTVVFL